MLGRATSNSDSQDSSWPGFGGSHHLPPYNILCGCPWGPHPNGFLSRDSQVRVSKLLKLGHPQLWGAITLCEDLWLRWSPKQSCIPHWELSNDMSHIICTHKNWVDSRLLMVGSQIANLTPGLSFGHNLCFICPNGRCKLILDIHVPRAFQWYKERLKPLRFDPCNCPLKIQESTGTSTPKVEPLRGVKVHSLTPSHTPGSMLCES